LPAERAIRCLLSTSAEPHFFKYTSHNEPYCLKYALWSPQTRPHPPRYIWQHSAWPQLTFDAAALATALEQARLEQGRLLGLLGAIGLEQANAVQRELWVQEALATAAIEGEQLNLESLRSSVAHRLQLADAPGPDRSVEGLVQVMQDALANHSAVLDLDRLCRWQSALFPGGTSGITRLAVGRVRNHADVMQIVSGALGREVVHYEAPPSAQVAAEMKSFLAWFESTRPASGASSVAKVNGIVRAALVHLWFESIHPFEDGNARLGRALADMALAQDMHAQDAQASPVLVRVYGLAHQMLKTRATYCDALSHAQRLRDIAPEAISIDATPWVQWFVQAFTRACIASQAVVMAATEKAQFRLGAACIGLISGSNHQKMRSVGAAPETNSRQLLFCASHNPGFAGKPPSQPSPKGGKEQIHFAHLNIKLLAALLSSASCPPQAPSRCGASSTGRWCRVALAQTRHLNTNWRPHWHRCPGRSGQSAWGC
jgi:Fic family protein